MDADVKDNPSMGDDNDMIAVGILIPNLLADGTHPHDKIVKAWTVLQQLKAMGWKCSINNKYAQN